MTQAIVDLSDEDVEVIAELGKNAEIIQNFIQIASDRLASNAEEQDSLTYMSQQILKGILILNKLRPTSTNGVEKE